MFFTDHILSCFWIRIGLHRDDHSSWLFTNVEAFEYIMPQLKE